MMLIKTLLRWIAGSHLLIAVAASAFTWSAYLQLSITPNRSLIALIGFATLLTYNAQNLMGRITLPGRESLLPYQLHLISALAGAAGTAFCLHATGGNIAVWLFIPALLSLLYAAPLFPFRGLRIALREVPWLKIYLILFVWLWVSAVIPQLYSRQEVSGDFLFFIFQRSLFLFSLLIPFDIRDLKSDYPFQRTIPQMLGVRRSLRVASVALAGFCTVATFRYLNGSIEPSILAALLLTGAFTWLLVARTDESRSELYYTVSIDSMLWVQLLLIWLFNIGIR